MIPTTYGDWWQNGFDLLAFEFWSENARDGITDCWIAGFVEGAD